MLKVTYKERTLSAEQEAFNKVVAERRSICEVCPKRKVFGPTAVCSACGCFIKMKTGTRGASCPINKW